jgi:hypothetical protein
MSDERNKGGMSDERADDSAIGEALAQEMLHEITASRMSYQSAPRDEMREPWGGHFRPKKLPPLALSATGEA